MKGIAPGALLVVLACFGCSDQYLRTGEPKWSNCTNDTVTVPRDNFDAINPGMTRADAVAYLGKPTDTSLNVMHWEMGTFSDAWVVFDDSGTQVVSKYWEDERTLRLEDVPQFK